MNLKNNPTEIQLQRLLARADDDAAHHLLWVGKSGEVHLDPLPENMNPIAFSEQRNTEMKFRLESFDRGNGYVGQHAAEDGPYVARLLGELTDAWVSGVDGYEGCYEAV